MRKVTYSILYCTGMSLLLSIAGCKKFVEVDMPRTQLTKTAVYESDATAQSVLASVYSRASSQNVISFSMLAALSADELTTYHLPDFMAINANAISTLNKIVADEWNESYSTIYLANAFLEGLAGSTRLTDSLKKQMQGEALFIRAFTHYYLCGLWGDVPYITTTDYRTNGLVFRQPVSVVQDSIISDLEKAATLVGPAYNYSGGERVRVNKSAVAAMLARMYLYKEKWAQAEAEADKVISNPLYQLKMDVNDVFLKNSTEAILQFPPGGSDGHTRESVTFNTPSTSLGSVRMQPSLMDAFEPGDQRRLKWIGTGLNNSGFFPLKYKVTQSNPTGAEYSMVLRMAEMYLVRAEARAKQNKLTGDNSAASDINVIRQRANLGVTSATDLTSIMAAIAQERRIELFTEWGDRWFNLKRTGAIDAVMLPLKPGWKSTAALYPIPNTERLLNPNLSPNPGY